MQNKKDMVSKIVFVIESIAVLFGGLASAMLENWCAMALCAALWISLRIRYIQKKELKFWQDIVNDCLKSDKDVQELYEQTKEKYRAALRSLKESDEIISILDKEDATIRYIRTKARMCAGRQNCVGCPLKEAGRNVSDEELNTEGCQHMGWCELYEFLHPAEAAVLVLKWEEKHAKG